MPLPRFTSRYKMGSGSPLAGLRIELLLSSVLMSRSTIASQDAILVFGISSATCEVIVYLFVGSVMTYRGVT